MAITKTTVLTRTSTSVPFYVDAGRAAVAANDAATLPHFQTMWNALTNLYNAGKYTIAESVSDDGLTQTRTLTYNDLDTLNQAETAYDIANAREFQSYKINNNFVTINGATVSAEERGNLWRIEGIDSPYTVTTTYTFPNASDAYIDTFVGALENYDHFSKLTDLVINGASVIVTHQYLNAADQTAHPYLDMFFIPQLAEKNVTRTVAYAMV
jgi:hypothetical protein